MFETYCVLFCFLVGAVVLLLRRSVPARASQKANAMNLVEQTENNRMITAQGDVVFCYRLHLPECYSLAEEQYDRLNEIWRIALKEFPQGTIVLRSDRYDRQPFDASAMPENSYIRREEKRYAAQRMQTCDASYLFVVFTGFRSVRDVRRTNPFIALSHRQAKAEDAAYRQFVAAVDSMYQQLSGAGGFSVEPMDADEIRDYTRYYFNGFQSDFLTDAEAAESFVRIGDRFVGAVSIEHERQFPEVLRSPQPGRSVRIPVGITEDLGVALPIPHLYNQMIVLTGHEREFEQVKRTLDTFRKNRGFSEEIEDQMRRLDKTREALSDDLDALLVRGHTNVIFWAESEDLLKTYRSTITNLMKQERDFEPVVPIGGQLRSVFYCSHPATVACMDRDSFYLVDLKQAVALFQQTGGYRSDDSGIYYSDPIDHLPLRYDLYDANKRYVDSRNIAVIGRTGGGKTVCLESVIEGYHNDPDHDYVNIVVDCGGSYDKAARLYDPEEVFIFRYSPDESLGLDPFAVGTTADSDRVDDICETLWLMIKPDREPSAEERVSLRRIVLSYLENSKEQSWPDFYRWVRDNCEQIFKENEIRESYFDIGQFVHNGSEWFEGGIYGNVLARSEDPTTRLQGKKLLIFELENIRQNPQLLSIVVHMIGIAIRTLVWEQPGRRGFIIYEEFAELMKIDIIFSAVLYQMQAIRKKGGSACIVLQNLDQLALNAGDRYRNDGGAAGALMKNIETTIFLAGADPAGFERYAPAFTPHDRQCVLALKNNYTTEPRYSSFYLFRSKKSALLTLCVSPRTFLAYQTEGEICDELGKRYAETGSMERAIELYEQQHEQSS
ncbi:MAG: hypothetical protein NC250_01010 [Alistipes senegalensis]|nr:hypothetical protein [Bacteroides cellulosilyticus]MCM1351300.1 hypothetical protein [Alistipes senegalensis]